MTALAYAPPWTGRRPRWLMNLLDLFDGFKVYLQHERRCQPKTLQAYATDFHQFLAWLDRTLDEERVRGVRPAKVRVNDLGQFTTERIRAWQVHLSQQGRSTSAIRRKLFALSSFARWLVTRGSIGPADNPMLQISKPKKRRRVRPGLSLEQWQKVMMLPLEPEPRTLRAILAFTGARREEIVSLRIGDVELGHPATLRVRGKGDKERLIPLVEPVRQLLLDYLLRRGETDPGAPLFVRSDGRPYHPSTLHRIVARWGKSVGVHLYPHLFRHVFATSALRSGVKLSTVQEWLGHEELATTAVYLHTANEPTERQALETWAGSIELSNG